jgi:hypothetical protein
MNCSRCAAELPESATFCPRCGTTTASGSFTSSTFSYLPAGAPPWPTTVPSRSLYATGASVSSQPVGTAPAKRPGRSAGSIVATVALIVLTPLVGIGITLGILTSQGLFPPGSASAQPRSNVVSKQPTVSATATPTAQGNQLPAPTSFKTTNSKDVNVSVQYPGDWVAETPQKSTSFTSLIIHTPQQEQAGIEFFVARYTDATSAAITNPDEINQANVSGISQQQTDSNVQIVPSSPSSQPTIGGTKWSQVDATYVDSTSSTKIHFVTISAQHNKIYYNIAFLMPDQYYNEAMQKYIQHMLDSFEFLS